MNKRLSIQDTIFINTPIKVEYCTETPIFMDENEMWWLTSCKKSENLPNWKTNVSSVTSPGHVHHPPPCTAGLAHGVGVALQHLDNLK